MYHAPDTLNKLHWVSPPPPPLKSVYAPVPIYKNLSKDPMSTQEARITRLLKRLEKQGDIPTTLHHLIRLTGSCPHRIYGLPKIHKPQVPLRPIVSCIGAPSCHLSKAYSLHHLTSSQEDKLARPQFQTFCRHHEGSAHTGR